MAKKKGKGPVRGLDVALPTALVEHALSFCGAASLASAAATCTTFCAAVPEAARLHLGCFAAAVPPAASRAKLLEAVASKERKVGITDGCAEVLRLVLDGRRVEAQAHCEQMRALYHPARERSMFMEDWSVDNSLGVLKMLKRQDARLLGRHLPLVARFLAHEWQVHFFALSMWQVRLRALEVLEVAEPHDLCEHADALKATLDDPSGLCRAASVRVLGRIGPTFLEGHVDGVLLPSLQDANSIVRADACKVVAGLSRPLRQAVLRRAEEMLDADRAVRISQTVGELVRRHEAAAQLGA